MNETKAIAIVGLGAILPDAPDAQTFWNNIKSRRYSITEVPTERWNPALYFDPDPSAADKTYTKIGGWVNNYHFDLFKAGIAIPPRVLAVMDEAQQWGIAATWQALKDYGYPDRQLDTSRVAVILGNAMGGEHHYRTSMRILVPEYVEILRSVPEFKELPENVRQALIVGLTSGIHSRVPEITEDTMPGELASIIAGRVANVFNFSGPNFVTDAACASSLAALNAAVEGLMSHQFDAAITGGVDRNMGPESFVKFCKIGALSPDGSRPYAEGANGFVQGEGTAIFIIKRLVDAERDGDKIYAVIRGIGGSSDGKGKGITAPNPIGQELAIERGWKDAGVSPSTAGLIEGHGTSTRVGDVAEANSLNTVFGKLDLPVGKISLGSVKSNIGHLKSAAGAAGLLKTTLALYEHVLPPSANFERPNPNIDFAHMPLRVDTELKPWEVGKGEVRRAGLSSFGFGGTNFHVVLEEYLPGVLVKEQVVFPSVKLEGKEQVTEKSTPTPEVSEGILASNLALEREVEAVKDYVLSLVSEKTGYPAEMLDLELDLEADLGIDTVKQAELFATMRSHYQIPRRDDLRLSDYNTLAKVIQFMTDSSSSGQNLSDMKLTVKESVKETVLRPEGSALQAFQGLLFLSADSVDELKHHLANAFDDAKQRKLPGKQVPEPQQLKRAQRLAIDFSDGDELIKRAQKAQLALETENPGAWQALTAQGIFRGSGEPGKVAFLFPGQGSQYINMLRELVEIEPLVGDTFKEADEVMTPLLGRPITSYIFVDGDEATITNAEKELKNTAITQPAMLTANTALMRLLTKYGIKPDYVLGHSLGEYAALVASEVLSFGEALVVVSARGREMAKLSIEDNGCMAAVSAPLSEVEKIISNINGYVVIANVNSPMQSVIGGSTKAVDTAIAQFKAAGLQAAKIPVSHAFHTKIVAPASGPLRKVIERMNIQAPKIPIIANVTGELYPKTSEEILDILAEQVASPVQMVKSMQTLYDKGVRIFLEVGPKRVLNALAADNLKEKTDVTILATNHPRKGAIPSINEALCGLYAAGVGAPEKLSREDHIEISNSVQTVDIESVKSFVLAQVSEKTGYPVEMLDPELDLEADLGVDTVKQAEIFAAIRNHYQIPRREDLRLSDYNTLTKVIDFMAEALGSGNTISETAPSLSVQTHSTAATPKIEAQTEYVKPIAGIIDGKLPLTGSVVISGAGLGLPGRNRRVFDDGNIQRILHGEMFIDPVTDTERKAMLDRRITRLVKSDAGAVMEEIEYPEQTIQLAGQRGEFDLVEEFGIPAERVESYDITTMLAIGAGIEALHDAGIPLVMRYKPTSIGTFLPDRWMLPEALADETGVIFASAFPGVDTLAHEANQFYRFQNIKNQIATLNELQAKVPSKQKELLAAINGKIKDFETQLADMDYHLDRRLIFGILPMGHSQFAEYIGARGPNTQVNAACASTTHAIGMAEDWIRQGRCRRVVVVAGDDITSEDVMPWVGSSFLASGAATQEGDIRLASLPFDRRRNGLIVGMGAAALVVEAEDSLRERGMRGICEVLATQFANSAFHGTRLDVSHVSAVMDELMEQAEQRFGIQRSVIAAQTVFVSHETYTPARGGSASAEIHALRQVFGENASQVVIANTKGFTGHSMGVGIEDVVAVKSLEYSQVPPIAHIGEGFEPDPELGDLNLSRGGSYPMKYALRLGAGFGSQIAMSLVRKIPGVGERIRKDIYDRWLSDVSGYEQAELEIYKKTLRVRHDGAPVKTPIKSSWKIGQGPTAWVDGTKEEIKIKQPIAQVEPKAAISIISESKTEKIETHPIIKSADVNLGDVKEYVLSVVSEKTGYPVEMLDLNLDLEADLGIDTVKQAELFATIRGNYNIPRREDLRLSDYNTLAKVIAFMQEAMGEGISQQESVAPAAVIQQEEKAEEKLAVSSNASLVADSESIKDYVLGVVSEKTGYPIEMLDLNLDLEADLGIDTVKQAELFATIRTHYQIERREDLRLSDYNTLSKVISFMKDALGQGEKPIAESSSEVVPVEVPQEKQAQALETPERVVAQPVPIMESIEAQSPTGIIKRRVPIPVLRPCPDLCVPTGVKLEAGTRVVIISDEGKVGDSLARKLRGRKVQVLRVKAVPGLEIKNQISKWLNEGPINGVYFLPALDAQKDLKESSEDEWQSAMTKILYTLVETMHAIPDMPFLVSATSMGGLHGYSLSGASNPMGGGVSGFTKALSWERPEVLNKVVDFSLEIPAGTVANRLIEETLNDPGIVEVGWEGDVRFGIALLEKDLPTEVNFPLESGNVFVISGGAGGIVAPVTINLAEASQGTFYLLDLMQLPERDDPDLIQLKTDPNTLRMELMQRMSQGGAKVTPVQVENRLSTLKRAAATLEMMDKVNQLDGKAYYLSCDLTDRTAVRQVIQKILKAEGHVDVLLHAAGLERSRKLENKPSEEFRQIVSVKVDGFFNLFKSLEAKRKLPQAVVFFCSVAGRFGNSGQTDYSAANDILCKLASSMHRQYPSMKTISIDWAPWAEIGMASRGYIPALMERAEIDMIHPDEAVPLVRAELQYGASNEVVLAGSLGLLTTPRYENSGLDVERADAALREGEPIHTMFSHLTSLDLYKGITLEAELDPTTQPFLRDHSMNGIPILPGVMGIEGFSVASKHIASVLASSKAGFEVEWLEDIRFLAPFKFFRNQTRHITWRALAIRESEGLVVNVTLESELMFLGKKVENVLNFSGKVHLQPVKQEIKDVTTKPPKWNGKATVKPEDIYKVYFHGPSFQVLDGAQRSGDVVLGKLRSNLPPLTSEGQALISVPMLVELCFQTAGIWEAGATGYLSLPSSIHKMTLFRHKVNGVPIYAEVKPVRENGSLHFDARVIDAKGRLYLELSDYRTSPLPYTVEKDLIDPFKVLMKED